MSNTNQASEDELKVLLEGNGWKFYEELNGFRKESKYTIPMFSTYQQTNYDELSAGNYYELKQAVQSAIRTEKLKLLDRLEAQFVQEVVVIFGETKFKKQVPLSAIEDERNRLNPSKSTPFNKLKEVK